MRYSSLDYDKLARELQSRPGFRDKLDVLAHQQQPSTTKAVDLSDCWSQNPWTIRHRNITRQCEITKADPKLAEKLKTEAARHDDAL